MVDSIEIRPIKVKKLSSMVEDSIKDMVVVGHLKPGDKLPSEKEMSEKFGVSSVTIREALRGLEVLGLIEKKRGRNGGIFINQNSDSIQDAVHATFTSKTFSLKDIDEVRENLQPFCARLAASRVSDDQIKALEENVEDSERKLEKHKYRFTEEAYAEIEERNFEFHRLLGVASCNPILALTVGYVEDFLRGYKRIDGALDVQECIEKIGQHRMILECVKRGDPYESEMAMRAHINKMFQRFPQKEKKVHIE